MSVEALAPLIDALRRCKADCDSADIAVKRARKAQEVAAAAHFMAEAKLNDAIRNLTEGVTP